MGKYNSYAKRADEAFKAARKTYLEALGKLKDAKLAENTANNMNKSDEKYTGEKEAKQAQAKALVIKAEADFKEAEKVWDAFDSTMKQLKTELSEEVRQSLTVDPDAIDNNAVKLLESGIMTYDDYANFVQKYDGNATMLKLISKYAEDKAKTIRADTSLNDSERARAAYFERISYEVRDGKNSAIKAFEQLETSMSYMSGRGAVNNNTLGGGYGLHRRAESQHVETMLNQYDTVMSGVIENF